MKSIKEINDIIQEDNLIDGLIKSNGLYVLVAKPKVGKSLLALQIANSISNGIPFLDMITSKQPVFYISTELNEKQSISSSHQDLIRKGFIYHNIDFNFVKMNENLSKIFIQLKYMKQLEKQIYTDLNLNMQCIEGSENLKIFEDRYFKNTLRNHIKN